MTATAAQVGEGTVPVDAWAAVTSKAERSWLWGLKWENCLLYNAFLLTAPLSFQKFKLKVLCCESSDKIFEMFPQFCIEPIGVCTSEILLVRLLLV